MIKHVRKVLGVISIIIALEAIRRRRYTPYSFAQEQFIDDASAFSSLLYTVLILPSRPGDPRIDIAFDSREIPIAIHVYVCIYMYECGVGRFYELLVRPGTDIRSDAYIHLSSLPEYSTPGICIAACISPWKSFPSDWSLPSPDHQRLFPICIRDDEIFRVTAP